LTRRLAVASSYDELVDAIRGRVDQLQISHAVLEELAGLTPGHFGKIMGVSQVKTMGMLTLFLVLETLAVRIVLEEDPELLAKMADRYDQRTDYNRRIGCMRSDRTRHKVMSEYGKLGADVRKAKLVPKRRAAIASIGGLARWEGVSVAKRRVLARKMVAARRRKRREAKRAAAELAAIEKEA